MSRLRCVWGQAVWLVVLALIIYFLGDLPA
jgi:hypothetical protein